MNDEWEEKPRFEIMYIATDKSCNRIYDSVCKYFTFWGVVCAFVRFYLTRGRVHYNTSSRTRFQTMQISYVPVLEEKKANAKL